MMLGEKLSAEDAQKIGMIYKVFEDDVFEKESWQIAVTLSEMPTKALGLTKQLLNSSLTNSLQEQLKQEEKVQAQAGLTADFKEGVLSFLEKRKAVFRGE